MKVNDIAVTLRYGSGTTERRLAVVLAAPSGSPEQVALQDIVDGSTWTEETANVVAVVPCT
jgi:hypothetical protein